MDTHLVVFYEDKVLIIIEIGERSCFISKAQVLDWYADNYAFERAKLSAVWSSHIKYDAPTRTLN